MNTRVLDSPQQDASGKGGPSKKIGFHQMKIKLADEGTANNEYIRNLRTKKIKKQTLKVIEKARALRFKQPIVK